MLEQRRASPNALPYRRPKAVTVWEALIVETLETIEASRCFPRSAPISGQQPFRLLTEKLDGTSVAESRVFHERPPVAHTHSDPPSRAAL
jgi:hypothetical protein